MIKYIKAFYYRLKFGLKKIIKKEITIKEAIKFLSIKYENNKK